MAAIRRHGILRQGESAVMLQDQLEQHLRNLKAESGAGQTILTDLETRKTALMDPLGFYRKGEFSEHTSTIGYQKFNSLETPRSPNSTFATDFFAYMNFAPSIVTHICERLSRRINPC